jgi:hypothetical protein
MLARRRFGAGSESGHVGDFRQADWGSPPADPNPDLDKSSSRSGQCSHIEIVP